MSLFLSIFSSNCHYLEINSNSVIIINPLTARVVRAPQMILQPVFSIFPCSPLPSGICRTPGLSIFLMLSSHLKLRRSPCISGFGWTHTFRLLPCDTQTVFNAMFCCLWVSSSCISQTVMLAEVLNRRTPTYGPSSSCWPSCTSCKTRLPCTKGSLI